jgi:hypothetical protein
VRDARYSFKKHTIEFEKINNMTLRIFAGDFKSGSADPDGFRLKQSEANLAEFIPLSNVQTLERFDNINEAMRHEECGIGTASTSGLDALAKLITNGKNTGVPFTVRFRDGRKMIASVEGEAWNQLVLKVADLLDGSPGEVTRSSVISESYHSYEQFDRIDWVAATPSWSSIVVGAVLPVFAIVALAFTIDAILCLAFEQWIGHFWTIPRWLVATMAFPLALVGTVTLAKLLMKNSTADPGEYQVKKSSSISKVLQKL